MSAARKTTYVVVLIAPDGTLSVQGPFRSPERAADHAKLWQGDDWDASVLDIESPERPE